MSITYSDYRIGFDLAIQHGKVIGQTRREALQNFVNTDTFFRTLFRVDHPFMVYEVRDKATDLEFRMFAPFLPMIPPMYCSIPLLSELGAIHAARVTERIKVSFYKYVKNYLIDIVHAGTEKERDSMVLASIIGGVRYDNILKYLELITQNVTFIKTSIFNDDTEIGLRIETRGNYSLIEPIELIYNKDSLAKMAEQCHSHKLNPSDELKKYFDSQVTTSLHRAKAEEKAPAQLAA